MSRETKEKNNLTNNKTEKKSKRKRLLFIAFISGVLLIASVYAWFSATLNVQIKFFNMAVASDTGLYISLDGIDFSSEISVSLDSILNDLTPRYPNHTNRWAISGLWPVSTNGVKNPASSKFSIYSGAVVKRRKGDDKDKKYLFTVAEKDDRATPTSLFLAFDFFLKNVSYSPYPDNLFFETDSMMALTEDTPDEVREVTGGVINSLRFGIVFMDTVNLEADVKTIQNIGCNNKCQSAIWEPNSTSHNAQSIEKAKDYGITLVDGVYIPTYSIIREGGPLEHTNGQAGTGIPLNTNYFVRQNTITDLNDPIFKIPNGITKCRGYLWIEGQDIDSLEADGVKHAVLDIIVSLTKDLSGYDF